MIKIASTTDYARLERALGAFGQKQLPYAGALALTRTAQAAAAEMTRALLSIFDKKGSPTPFTLRAIGITPARKSNLTAAIFVKRQQARYLGIEETGGVRLRAPGAPVLTPVDVAKNAYGNIPRGLIRRLAAEPDRYFLAKIHGVYGLWERITRPGARHVLRTPRGVRLLVAFRPEAHYRPKFGFDERVRRSVEQSLMPNLQAAVSEALATAFGR